MNLFIFLPIKNIVKPKTYSFSWYGAVTQWYTEDAEAAYKRTNFTNHFHKNTQRIPFSKTKEVRLAVTYFYKFWISIVFYIYEQRAAKGVRPNAVWTATCECTDFWKARVGGFRAILDITILRSIPCIHSFRWKV